MNHKSTLFAALLAAAGFALAPTSAQAGKLVFAEQPVEGRYIVVLKDGSARLAGESDGQIDGRQTDTRRRTPTVAEVATAMSDSYRLSVERSFNHVLRGFVATADDAALEQLLLDERVAYVEEDGVVSISATQSNATWGLDRIDQRDRPLNGTYVYDTTAANVNIYVVDTGIRPTHNEFGGRVYSGFSAINDGRGSNDCNGHGTHVAGTAGGSVYGVAKGARLFPVRVLDCQGSGTNSGVIAGMDWVAGNHSKPAVANMSLGGGASTATDQAVTRMRNAGVTVVVAAGNENQNACNVSPARSSAAITVGSTTSTDARSSFSNWGSCVNIFAPGSSITAAWHTSNTALNTINGTSMASPHVAGVAALYLAANPSATPAQVEAAIYNNATPNKVTNAGSGSANRLLYSLFSGGGGGGGGNPPPDPGPGSLENGTPVTGLSGSAGSERRFTVQIPAGASNLHIQIGGGSGDADLYVRRGSAPTTGSYDCRPWRTGNNESCTFASPQSGTWHVMVRGYSAYSGVSLVATWDTGSSAPCSNCTRYTGSLSGSGQAQVQPDGNYYTSGAGIQRGWLEGPANADFDLELYRWSGSSWVRVARSINTGSSEQVAYNGSAGYYYWRIVSYSGSGSYQFWMQQP